jgi:dTMP kinase
MTSSISTGRLIVVEGADGIGKSTQIALLRAELAGLGREIVAYDFPNKRGTPIGELIGGFLGGRFGEVAPEFLSLAFAVDRLAERERMRADLARGAIVLCDRYVASNIAYQSAKIDDPARRDELHALLSWVEYDLFALPRPDVEIAMVGTPDFFRRGGNLARGTDATRAYAAGEADIHEARPGLQVAVDAYYRTTGAAAGLAQVPILDPAGDRRSVEHVAEDIWALVAARL